MGNYIRKIAIGLIAALFTSLFMPVNRITYAASKYITRKEVIKLIAEELQLPINSSNSEPYIEAAKQAGLLTNTTFKSYKLYASKIDIAILLVRADEYLNGITTSEELIKEIIEDRISDISKVSAVLQPYLAKAYALGYIKGNRNGLYSTNRTLNPKYKVTAKYAKLLIQMIHDTSKRHRLSPDGQVIRTKDLPEFAEYYPYILESYPNEYYDWKFEFMQWQTEDGPLFGTDKCINLQDYAAPVDFIKYKNEKPAFNCYINRTHKSSSKEVYDACADQWINIVKDYLNCVFNFDYGDTNRHNEWKEKMIKCNHAGLTFPDKVSANIDVYIDRAIDNETIVQASKVGVDKSSIYIGTTGIYVRVYIRYKIVSSKTIDSTKTKDILYTDYNFAEIDNIKRNEWRDGYFDIKVSCNDSNCGVSSAVFVDYFHEHRVVFNE